MSQIVFDKDGKAGILTGQNHEGAETVVWLGEPEVISTVVDGMGNGEPAYSTSYPSPQGAAGGNAFVDGSGAPSAVPLSLATPETDANYQDNQDGTYTRSTDGAKGTFGPNGFIVTQTAPETPTDDATYTDNHDSTFTRDSDGARGTFGPNGFTPAPSPQI